MDLVAWAAAAVLAVLGGSRARIGGLLGAGLSAVTFGLFASDLATGTAGHEGVGTGMVLTLGGWLACALGSALALMASRGSRAADDARDGGTAGMLRRPRRSDIGTVTLLVLCAIGASASFVPSWDSYTLTESSVGSAQTLTLGNAFDNPGWVIFADMATVALLIAVAIAAGLWRPARHGSALLAGAIVAMAGQANLRAPGGTPGHLAGDVRLFGRAGTGRWAYDQFWRDIHLLGVRGVHHRYGHFVRVAGHRSQWAGLAIRSPRTPGPAIRRAAIRLGPIPPRPIRQRQGRPLLASRVMTW